MVPLILLDATRDRDADVRVEGVSAVGQLFVAHGGDREVAVARLDALLDDPDRRAASKAISRIQGELRLPPTPPSGYRRIRYDLFRYEG